MRISDTDKRAFKDIPKIVNTRNRLPVGSKCKIPIDTFKIFTKPVTVIFCIIPESFNLRRSPFPVKFTNTVNKFMVTKMREYNSRALIFIGQLTAMMLIKDSVSLVILVGSVISCLKSKQLKIDFSRLQSGSFRLVDKKQQLRSPQRITP